jgi:hypothetical protein
MSDVWECTEEDEAVMARFSDQLYRAEYHDFVAPHGNLRACVDDPTLDADDLRQAGAGELWEACALDYAPDWEQESNILAWGNLGSSSTRDRYDLRGHDGSQSLEEKFEDYFIAKEIHPRMDVLDQAAQRLAALWPRGKQRLKVASLDDAVCCFKDDTNFGYPRCNSDQAMNLHYYYLESVRIEERGFPLADVSDYPSIGTSRAQSTGYHRPGKSRALSMFCRAVSNHEKRVQIAGFTALRDLHEFVAWNGQRQVDIAMTRLLDEAPDVLKLSADFTRFDSTVPFEVLTRVYGVVSSWFEWNAQNLIRFVGEAMMRSGIYLPPTARNPSGYFHGGERRRGISSGSALTNWIGSLTNILVFNYAAIRDGGSVEKIHVNGDDAVVLFKGTTAARVSEILENDLGMIIKMDPAKNLVSKSHIKFLQMDHHCDFRLGALNVGLRPFLRVFNKMTGHERRRPTKRLGTRDEAPTRWKGTFNTYRWLQQMEPCWSNDMFPNFCEWQMSKDRYLEEALIAIIEGDPEVDLALSMLASDEGEGKFTVKSLRKSKVVAELCRQYGTSIS